MFKTYLDDSINSLKRLTYKLLDKIGRTSYIDKAKLYNYKGLEIDDNDIQYIKNNECIYLSPDGTLLY
jgi:hypothetical protein